MGRRKKKEAGVDISLPITPMLDMSFQLLSFFILTFKPMPQEGQLMMNMPKIDTSTNITDTPLPTEDKKEEYSVRTISDNGLIRYVYLIGPTSSGDKEMDIDLLTEELKKIPKPGNCNITITCDPDLKYANLIALMDRCKRVGFESVGIGPNAKKN